MCAVEKSVEMEGHVRPLGAFQPTSNLISASLCFAERSCLPRGPFHCTHCAAVNKQPSVDSLDQILLCAIGQCFLVYAANFALGHFEYQFLLPYYTSSLRGRLLHSVALDTVRLSSGVMDLSMIYFGGDESWPRRSVEGRGHGLCEQLSI
jgi:hypothetical protein